MKRIRFLTVLLALNFYGLQSQSVIWSGSGHPDGLQVNGVSFSASGQSVVSGTNCHPAKIRLFNRVDGNLEWDYTVNQSLECIMGVGFSANGQYLATVEETGNLLIFDFQQQPPTLISTIPLNTDYAFSLAFSPDSKHLAIGASSGKLKTYRLSDGTAGINVTAHNPWVTALAYAPDNTRIVTGGSENRVRIWDTTGVLLKTLVGHTGDISAIRVTSDNQRIISGSLDGTVKIWDFANGTLLTTIQTSTGSVHSLDMSPDGVWLVAACGDGLLHLYNLNTYVEMGSFGDLNEGNAITVDWSPTENIVVTGTTSSKVVLYDVSLSTPALEPVSASACQVFPNPVTDHATVEWLGETPLSAELFDQFGKLMSTLNLETAGNTGTRFSIPAQLPKGMYTLKLLSVSGNYAYVQILHP